MYSFQWQRYWIVFRNNIITCGQLEEGAWDLRSAQWGWLDEVHLLLVPVQCLSGGVVRTVLRTLQELGVDALGLGAPAAQVQLEHPAVVRIQEQHEVVASKVWNTSSQCLTFTEYVNYDTDCQKVVIFVFKFILRAEMLVKVVGETVPEMQEVPSLCR